MKKIQIEFTVTIGGSLTLEVEDDDAWDELFDDLTADDRDDLAENISEYVKLTTYVSGHLGLDERVKLPSYAHFSRSGIQWATGNAAIDNLEVTSVDDDGENR